MKQTKIVMSLVFSVFVLSGCGDKDERDGKEDCDKKGAGWLWDEASKQCKSVVVTTEGDITEENCKAKGDGWTWDETSKQCDPLVEYMTITIPDADTITILDANGVERDLIAGIGGGAILYNIEYGGRRIHPGECVKVHKSYVPEITVQLRGSIYYDYHDVLCSQSPEVPPCLVGNYEVVKVKDRNDKLTLKPLSSVDVDSCRDFSPALKEIREAFGIE